PQAVCEHVYPEFRAAQAAHASIIRRWEVVGLEREAKAGEWNGDPKQYAQGQESDDQHSRLPDDEWAIRDRGNGTPLIHSGERTHGRQVGSRFELRTEDRTQRRCQTPLLFKMR